jgi:mono/diheme cytochrome c family protein
MEKAPMTSARVFILGLCAGLLVSAVAVSSRGQNGAASARFDYRELGNVPEKARLRNNPMERDPKAVPVGKKLFGQHCAECHGSRGEGSKKAPSLQAEEVQQAAPGALFWILTNGVVRRGMPVWSKLPEPQRWNLVSYIQTLKPSTEGTSPTGAGPR